MINNVFKITIAGEADFNLFGAIKAEITATLTLTFTSTSFNITLSDDAFTIPTIQATPIGTADGSLTIANANGTLQIWGGFLLTANLTALNSVGIYSSAQVFIKLNTTGQTKTVMLTNGTLSLDPESFSLFINGVAEFRVNNKAVFELSGTMTFQINAASLTIFVQAQLLLGPNPNSPIMVLNANGLIYVQMVEDVNRNNIIEAGFAAKMTLTMGVNAPVPGGITFGENYLLVMNTTGGAVTFTIPLRPCPPTRRARPFPR